MCLRSLIGSGCIVTLAILAGCGGSDDPPQPDPDDPGDNTGGSEITPPGDDPDPAQLTADFSATSWRFPQFSGMQTTVAAPLELHYVETSSIPGQGESELEFHLTLDAGTVIDNGATVPSLAVDIVEIEDGEVVYTETNHYIYDTGSEWIFTVEDDDPLIPLAPGNLAIGDEWTLEFDDGSESFTVLSIDATSPNDYDGCLQLEVVETGNGGEGPFTERRQEWWQPELFLVYEQGTFTENGVTESYSIELLPANDG